MNFRRIAASGVALATLALAACASGSSAFTGSRGTEEAGQPSLTIAADGSFNGTDGCNSMVGKGTFNGDTFEFGEFASTMMACEGIDTWLSAAGTATVSGGKLAVAASDGTEIGTLAKR